jgi:hypothetical protein
MSRPFVLWTMQRTGGTALADALMRHSEHPSAEHEPFNWSRDRARESWPIVERWIASGDRAGLVADLQGLASNAYLIKHCFELFSASFNVALLEATAGAGYRHILLRRMDETARLVSKFIAEAHGAWFPEYGREVYADVANGDRQLHPIPVDLIRAQCAHARNSEAALRQAFEQLGVTPIECAYESLYLADAETRAKSFDALLDGLEFAAADRPALVAACLKATEATGQGTFAVVKHVPNLEAVLDGLEAMGCAPSAAFEQRRRLDELKAQLSALASARAWTLVENLDQPWPGLSLKFDQASSLEFRIESADGSFSNVYFGVKNAIPVHNKSLGEALFLALGDANYSETWPWCRHPTPADEVLPIPANWFEGDALKRHVPDGALASRIVAAAEEFRRALAASGYLAVSVEEWTRLNNAPPVGRERKGPARP